MTADIDREKLRELCERTTPGPWAARQTVIHGRAYRGMWVERDDGELSLISGSGGAKSFTCRVFDTQNHDNNDADMMFVAAARTALPALLDLTDAQAAKIAELETENAGLAAGSSYDEAEAARIDEALAIFSSDLSEFETRADAVWCLVRAWENVIETLDLGDTGDDPVQRVREMVEYIGVSNAARASLESERDQLRKQVEAMAIIDQLRADEGNYVTFVCDNPDFNDQPNCAIEVCAEWTAWAPRRFSADTVLDCLRFAAASALEQKEQG